MDVEAEPDSAVMRDSTKNEDSTTADQPKDLQLISNRLNLGRMMRMYAPGTLWSARPSARKLCIVAARAPRTPSSKTTTKTNLPSKGYFAEADPNAEVYAKTGKKFDPTKKKGRWEPEFIWNTNWQEALAREEQEKAAREEAAAKPPAQAEGGFLRLSRLSDMASMDSDISAELRGPKAPAPPKIELPNMTFKPVYPKPTMFEARKWVRGGKFSDKVVPISAANEALIAANEARIAQEKAQYEKLKAEFQAWNLGLAACTFAITYALYSQDTAVSYLAGALGGMLYLRLLNQQVDGIGGGGVGSALGPPRLLVPVILVLGYNRWNEIAVEATGVHAELIPMLLGFFTYKGAVIARQGLQLMNDITDQTTAEMRGGRQSRQVAGGLEEGAGGAAVPSIDDAMAKKILTQ